MKYSKPVQTRSRRTLRIPFPGLPVVIAAIAVVMGYPLLASSAPTASAPGYPLPISSPRVAAPTSTALSYPLLAPSSPTASAPIHVPRSEYGGTPGAADGLVPYGTTVFNGEFPGVTNLDPALLDALREAAKDAEDDGIEFDVNSGWRSPEYQQQLLQEAFWRYGSEEEAARWVATPAKSAHVSGDAVDIGPSDAAEWLHEYGADYGLCRIYGNEAWHYELRSEAIENGCPPMYADPTHDPRMQK